MFRLRAALILIAMAPGCAFAQRYGRADSIQIYYPKTPKPILNIDYQSAKTWSYTRLSGLLKMKWATVSVSDPKTSQKNLEGVTLNQLVSNASSYRVEVYRDFWAFEDKLAISSTGLDMHFDMILADTMNGTRLGPDHPFCLIARNNRGDLVLAYIKWLVPIIILSRKGRLPFTVPVELCDPGARATGTGG